MTVWVVAAVIAVMVWSLRSGARAALAGIGWYELFFLFLSSAFLGDCFETVYVFLGTGVLMSRSSLLYAPLSLVWGAGAVLMTLVLMPLARKGNAALFAGGVVLGGGFEYLASWVLELATGRLFWDYSRMPFNLDGRTNLLYALFWGAAGVFWVRVAAPGCWACCGRSPAGPEKSRRWSWPCCSRWTCPCRPRRCSGWRSAAGGSPPPTRWSRHWMCCTPTPGWNSATRTCSCRERS